MFFSSQRGNYLTKFCSFFFPSITHSTLVVSIDDKPKTQIKFINRKIQKKD